MIAVLAALALACPAERVSVGYTARVDAALSAGRDVWGEALIRSRSGPTDDAVRRLLPPLLYARRHEGPLTASGVHYVPFGQPLGPFGAGTVSLHVADGSQILWDKADGPALDLEAGRERYGSCLARLSGPRLADGWLPILKTAYTDARGRRYTQESFAGGVPLAAYVHLTGGGRVGPLAGEDVYATWAGGAVRRSDAKAYGRAREAVVRYWQGRLREGVTFEAPERHVMDAERALLVQNLLLGWRYGSGNAYEELSYPESPDVAGVMGEYGFQSVERATLAKALGLQPSRYPNWERGELLLAVAREVALFGDKRFLRIATPTLTRYVKALERAYEPRVGLLAREQFSSDIPDRVYGLHAQAMIWQGLRAVSLPGAQALAAKLETGLRRAVRASERRLSDGSLFVPVRLLDGIEPYVRLTESRDASYWNLVMPYALASGLFPSGSPEAGGVLRYLLLHGSRFLGLARAGAFSLYGKAPAQPASGTDNVYELNVARFLADNDRPDELVLSLYGALGAGMTPGTFVAGEAASLAPLGRASGRTMYLPPNSAANAAFLETLRLTLVHETADGLELAFATPRAWLRPGARIAVDGAPTGFGRVSFELRAGRSEVDARLVVPRQARTLLLRLRLPAGHRLTSVSAGRLLADGETIELSGRRGTVRLTAAYR